ncbi:ATP-binding cassette domain-containing protein [Novispirillum sp. DQ9]|uniref:ATP-binding cassette domain-containing protein n=1 Tax=Novispirillum sp. DQ9 TaxID=3398612 RepID=UPI003C7D4AD3
MVRAGQTPYPHKVAASGSRIIGAHHPHPPAHPAAALEVRAVGFGYGDRVALDGVSFSIAAGRFTALLGPNGAGKSTLYSLLTRLLRPHAGTIRIHGHDLDGDPRRALAGLGVVFQQPTLDLDLSVAQNLAYFASLHGLSRRAARARAEEELARVDLLEHRDDRVRALSGGQRRRVEIARALLHRPSLLLLDEPTVGLDRPSRLLIRDHVHALCRERGIAALWATHLIDEVDPDTDHVVLLHKGRVVAAGPAAAVTAQAGADSLAAAFDTLTEAAPCPP